MFFKIKIKKSLKHVHWFIGHRAHRATAFMPSLLRCTVVNRFMVQMLQDTPLFSRLPKEKATDKHLSKYVLLV
jgi:hypothetical protein